MSRKDDVLKAIEKIREQQTFTKSDYEEMKIALLGHIAIALAEIADKLTEEEVME